MHSLEIGPNASQIPKPYSDPHPPAIPDQPIVDFVVSALGRRFGHCIDIVICPTSCIAHALVYAIYLVCSNNLARYGGNSEAIDDIN